MDIKWKMGDCVTACLQEVSKNPDNYKIYVLQLLAPQTLYQTGSIPVAYFTEKNYKSGDQINTHVFLQTNQQQGAILDPMYQQNFVTIDDYIRFLSTQVARNADQPLLEVDIQPMTLDKLQEGFSRFENNLEFIPIYYEFPTFGPVKLLQKCLLSNPSASLRNLKSLISTFDQQRSCPVACMSYKRSSSHTTSPECNQIII